MPESEYEVELFRKQGFTRQTCSKCSTPFWSLGIHETCGEAPCQEYDFIGASPFKKKLTYRAMREDFLSFLEQNGHTRVKRYPIVARWREVVFGGAEPATLVFMMNREINGHRVPMDTQVVDTGYGLERPTWLSQATTSAYEAVFGEALAYLKRATGAKRVDGRVLREYSKVAGMLKVETLADIRTIRQRTAERVGISVDELVAQVSPLEALYIVCDHSRALIFLLGDGVVPSNSREGYFARLLVRRGLRALKDLNITYSLGDTVSFMIDQIREDYPEFFFNKGDILKLLKVEESRYKETLEKGRATVGKIATQLTAAGKGFDVETLLELYDSHGLNPDVVQEFTDLPIEIPDDFYRRVAARHERPVAEPTNRIAIPKELPTTKLRVY